MDRLFDITSFFATGPLMLAPMAGINDAVFRLICKRMGASLTYTEMVSSKGLQYENPKTDEMLRYLEDEAPFAVQLFGSDPETMARMAVKLEERCGESLALIDVNMGCPSRKIVSKGDGAALMRTPDLAHAILASVVASVSIPVTVKFRKGFELYEDSAVEFACAAEAAGCAAVCVHGRTARQYYQGRADRFTIDRVVAAVKIPVIASGDVFTSLDIDDYFSRGAAGVMVARGAQGNPWIFRQVPARDNSPSIEERVAVAREHCERLYEFDPRRLVSMRRHIAWYLKGAPQAAMLRRALNECNTLDDYKDLLERVSL